MKSTTVRLRDQEQGIGHVLMVVLVVVVLGVIGFAGYTVANKSNPKASTKTTTTTTTSEQSATNSGCVAAYHDANLCKFSTNASLDKVAYKATLTVVNDQGTSNMTLQHDTKGNTSSTITGSGQTIGTVMLDGNSYIQATSGGVWYEYPKGSSTDSSSSDASDPTSSMKLVLGAGITYKPEGKEACGSLTCFKYEVTDTATPNTVQTVWFDTQHYLLREWKAVDSTDTTDMQISYPSSVTISKPSPVQLFTAQ